MFCDHNPGLESRNFIDGKIFTRDDPCIWVVYPAGAAGDLLISIIDKHYLRTGCEYYGINDLGRVMIYTTDYEMIDMASKNNHPIKFDDQWFYDLSDSMSNRNLTYSMLDQVIFGCHFHHPERIQQILDNFSKAKIINVYPQNRSGALLIKNLAGFKLDNKNPTDIKVTPPEEDFQPNVFQHPRVLNIPFGFLFNRSSYDRYYENIRQFLDLSGPLICFEYIEFYLSKQQELIQTQLKNYSINL